MPKCSSGISYDTDLENMGAHVTRVTTELLLLCPVELPLRGVQDMYAPQFSTM